MFEINHLGKRSIATLTLVMGLYGGSLASAHAQTANSAAQPAMTALAGPTNGVASESVPLPPPMPAKKTMEVVDNPYGMSAIWAQGDFVARGTLLIMIIMSMGSWYILVTKLLEQRKLFSDAKKVRQLFWTANTLEQGVDALPQEGAFCYVAKNAVEARNEHQGALAKEVALNNWIEMAFDRAFEEIQARLQVGLAFLGTVGATAPFVGLFGTVWGIYHALTAIGIAGQASIDKVAGPVGESLIMTAIGLAVAVPAVLGYNWLVRRNKSALAQVHAFAADLEKCLLGGSKPKSQS
ncbi:MotA/TolQ/ExbB proton channel family protein [Rhodoferax sp.]|uniref:MotA/TolQ/ExbB proton channel family protein n=1 Tax=Rhodoferax sp. TaxID=50421 RepID=UPI00351CD595